MKDLPYIKFSQFEKEVPQSINHREKWDLLSEDEKVDLYHQVHWVIDFKFIYVGEVTNPETMQAFPRNFNELISNCNLTLKQKTLLEKYNRKIPNELRAICVTIARNLLNTQDVWDLIVLRKQTGASRVQDGGGGGVEIEFKFIAEEYDIESVIFLKQFQPLWFAFNR